MNADAQLRKVERRHPLPDGWESAETVFDRLSVDDLALHRAGLSARSRGREATGSAVDLQRSPVRRAYFELFERASTFNALERGDRTHELYTPEGAPCGVVERAGVFPESDDPATWRYAISNGVAAHIDWARACQRAVWELAERDRVLRAWYGEISPRRLDVPRGVPLFDRTRTHAWSIYDFPAGGGAAWSRGIEVVGVYGFPFGGHVPLVYGYGARPALLDACAAAIDEATQMLGFLWGEPIPEREPDASPGPLFHLEHFLVPANHARLHRWLSGAHLDLATHVFPPATTRTRGAVSFVDLTPARPTSLRVAKAISAAAVPLIFGLGPLCAQLPPSLRVHPIA